MFRTKRSKYNHDTRETEFGCIINKGEAENQITVGTIEKQAQLIKWTGYVQFHLALQNNKILKTFISLNYTKSYWASVLFMQDKGELITAL